MQRRHEKSLDLEKETKETPRRQISRLRPPRAASTTVLDLQRLAGSSFSHLPAACSDRCPRPPRALSLFDGPCTCPRSVPISIPSQPAKPSHEAATVVMSKDASSTTEPATAPATATADSLRYVRYDPARETEYVAAMRQLISKDLSEPYSIYVYRYFLYQWGELCFMAMDEQRPDDNKLVGVVVSKLEPHRGGPLRGYIAMLAVREEYRGRGIATRLVRMAIDAMIERGADEVCSSFLYTNWLEFVADGMLTGRPRDRNLQHGRHQAVPAPGLSPQQAPAPLLPQRQLGLPPRPVSQGGRRVHPHVLRPASAAWR